MRWLAKLHSKTLRCNQQSENGSRMSGFYKWFPRRSLIYCPEHSWTYSVCRGIADTWRAKWAQCYKLHFKKQSSKINSNIFTSEESIYAVFSEHKPSQALEVSPFDPTVPIGKTSVMTALVGWHEFERAEVLVETCKAYFSFYLFEPDSCGSNCSPFISRF